MVVKFDFVKIFVLFITKPKTFTMDDGLKIFPCRLNKLQRKK